MPHFTIVETVMGGLNLLVLIGITFFGPRAAKAMGRTVGVTAGNAAVVAVENKMDEGLGGLVQRIADLEHADDTHTEDLKDIKSTLRENRAIRETEREERKRIDKLLFERLGIKGAVNPEQPQDTH